MEVKSKKHIFSKIINLILAIYLLFFLYQAGQRFFHNSQFEGKDLIPFQLQSLQGEKMLNIPQDLTPPYILFFWHVDCPPCLLSAKRFQKAIRDKEIPAQNFMAIHLGYDPKKLAKFMNKNNYDFPVYFDMKNKATKQFQVMATPTTIHINKEGKVQWVGTGPGLFDISRAQKLFSK
jgi:peroxiredoxin